MLNGCTTLTIEWALVLLSLAFVLLRVYVRFTSPSSGVNNSVTDTLVIFAWLALASMVACDSMLEKLSLLARPTPLDDKEVLILVNQNPEELVRMLKITYGSFFPYTLVMYLVKAAILSWYYTISPKTLPRQPGRVSLHILTSVCICGFLASMGLNFLWCWPLSRNWTLDGTRTCRSAVKAPAFYLSFGFHISTAILLFIYPFPIVYRIGNQRLRTQRRSSWGIFFLFVLGALAIASMIVRVVAIITRADTSFVSLSTTVECATGIILASCPTLRVLFKFSQASIRIHSKTPSTINQLDAASTDTYVSTRNVNMMSSEIWDGRDSTAPQWIRMESRANYDMGGKDLERGVYMGGDDLAEARAARDREEQTRKSAIRSSMGGYGYVYTPPKPQPGLYLHSGRGIVQHIPGTEPHGGMPSWMSLPDPQYLCEKNGNNPLMPSVPASIPTTKTIMHMVENHTPTSIFDKDEGDSIHGDRVMGTLALPPPIGNSSKRWSQGSFGDRKLKRKKEEDEEAMNTKSNGTFFFD